MARRKRAWLASNGITKGSFCVQIYEKKGNPVPSRQPKFASKCTFFKKRYGRRRDEKLMTATVTRLEG